MGQLARILAVAMLAALSGCAFGSGAGVGDGDGWVPRSSHGDRARVEVENGNWSDIDVWVIASNGGRHHLGHVDTGQTRSFPVELDRLGPTRELRFLADQTGADGILSPYILLLPGDVARWKVAFHDSNSNITVERPGQE